MSQTITLALRRAKFKASNRPILPPPPVINTTSPDKSYYCKTEERIETFLIVQNLINVIWRRI